MHSKKSVKKIKNTVLTNVLDFPADRKGMREELERRLIIEDPVSGSVPNSNPPINFHRINIGIKNPDGTEGDLIVDIDRSFSFGVGESKAPDTGVLNGYSISVSMYDRDGATDKQVRVVMFVEILAELLIEHILTDEVKGAMDKWDLEAALLKKLNPLFYKRDKGKIIEGSSPTFYPKLIWWRAGKDRQGRDKPARMSTTFMSEDEIDEEGEPVVVDPLDFLGVRSYVTPAVKFEGVFLGSKNNLQCKVYESYIKAAETGPKRLLKIASRAPSVVVSGINPLLGGGKADEEEKNEKPKKKKEPVKDDANDDDDANEDVPDVELELEPELVLSGDDEESEPAPKPKKKVVRKKVKAAKE